MINSSVLHHPYFGHLLLVHVKHDCIAFKLILQTKLRLLEEDNSSLEKLGIKDNNPVLIEGLWQETLQLVDEYVFQ